jgi:hypothetical protein
MANKIDSNVTGLRFTEETSIGVIPGSPVWYPLEPNSYKDFGGQLSLIARRPISTTRSPKKGAVTSIDANGGFIQDLTQNNLTRLLQGIMFADIREKTTTAPMNGTALTMTACTATTYTAASGLGSFLINSIVFGSGFGVAANNGIHVLSTVAATTLTTTGLAIEASPPAGSKVETVGYQFTSATLDVVIGTGYVRLNRASGAVDFTTLGLVVGEWIYVGGDSASLRFLNNRGYARVKAVAAGYIDLDKVDWTPQAETGTGLTVQIFFGSVIKNETTSALIKRRTYQLERQIGADTDGTMSEYLVGAVADSFALDIKQADKVTAEIDFIAIDNEQRTGLVGLKTGTRPTQSNTDAFNTSSDFSRIKLAIVDPTTAAPTPLFAYSTDLKLTVKNNVSPIKALGVLGAFDTATGMIDLSGSLTAYFSSIPAIAAVRNNSDVTLDIVMAKNNAGIAIDLPLIALGNGRLKVEMDKPITLPLDLTGAESLAGHMVLFSIFSYLPTVGM